MSLSDVLRERAEDTKRRRQEALREVERLAGLLRARFEFEALYLFGSILSDRFSRRSDIDLVIKGLEPRQFFRAQAFLLAESPYEIDLKPFEDMDEFSKDRVLREGLKIG